MTSNSHSQHQSRSVHTGHVVSQSPVSGQSQFANDDERTKLILVHAYGLWEDAGRPEGDEAREACWNEAENSFRG